MPFQVQSNSLRWTRDWHSQSDWILVDRTDYILARVMLSRLLGVESWHWAVTTTWPQRDGFASTVEQAKEQAMDMAQLRSAA